MQVKKTSFSNILFSDSHLSSPFKYYQKVDNGIIAARKVSTKTKVAAFAAALILAIPTLFIGSIISFYVITAISKYHSQKGKDTVKKVCKVASRHFVPRPLSNSQTIAKIPREWTTELRGVPTDGVSVRINNIGNTCWLNSLLKMFATDDYFDAVLNCTPEDIQNFVSAEGLVGEEAATEIEKRTNLHDHLRFIVHTLRDVSLNQRKYIDPQRISSLVEILHTINPEFGYTQCDPTEALDYILSLFHFQERSGEQQLPRVTTAYHNAILPRNAITEARPVISVSAASPAIYENRGIDLNKCVNNPQVENFELESDLGFRGDFEQRVGLTNAPPKITIHLERNTGNGKIIAPVNMDENLQVKIKSHAENHGRLDETQENTYEIVGAILHRGNGKNGHYTFIEKKGERLLLHDDSRLIELSKAEARGLIQRASTFRLRKIS